MSCIDASKSLRGLLHEVLHLFPVGDITWHTQYFCTALCQVVACTFECLRITGTEDQSTADTRTLSCQPQAQTPRAAGNQHHPLRRHQVCRWSI